SLVVGRQLVYLSRRQLPIRPLEYSSGRAYWFIAARPGHREKSFYPFRKVGRTLTQVHISGGYCSGRSCSGELAEDIETGTNLVFGRAGVGAGQAAATGVVGHGAVGGDSDQVGLVVVVEVANPDPLIGVEAGTDLV